MYKKKENSTDVFQSKFAQTVASSFDIAQPFSYLQCFNDAANKLSTEPLYLKWVRAANVECLSDPSVSLISELVPQQPTLGIIQSSLED